MGSSRYSAVPIFSLVDLRNPTPTQKNELTKCLLERGLFYLKDHKIQESDHEILKNTTLNFFEREVDDERLNVIKHIPGVRRGYSHLESESTAQVTNNGRYTDYSVCYSMGLWGNVFPSQDFEKVWANYFNRLYSTSQEVAKIVLESVHADCGESLDEFVKCDPLFRFRHFPEVPENRCSEYEPLRMAPHYDLSIVTLIHQTPCSNGFVSLQYEDGNGYVDLPCEPNTLLVMCGAVATIVSNGKIKAPVHRVSAPPSEQRVGSSRTSSVFFLRPKPTFEFSVPRAKCLGLKISLTDERTTFGKWIGTNYTKLQTSTTDTS